MKRYTLKENYKFRYCELLSKQLCMEIYVELESSGIVLNSTFDNEKFSIDWFEINVKEGFRWDGASPKFRIGKHWFGTWDGKYMEDLKRQCYYPTLIHDVLYVTFEKNPLTRKTIDLIFYEMMKLNEFKLADLYYIGVRLLGGIYHFINKFFY